MAFTGTSLPVDPTLSRDGLPGAENSAERRLSFVRERIEKVELFCPITHKNSIILIKGCNANRCADDFFFLVVVFGPFSNGKKVLEGKKIRLSFLRPRSIIKFLSTLIQFTAHRKNSGKTSRGPKATF